MEASGAAGGALLIHGLTDSPYSLRRTAEIINASGLYVVGLRLPGHGTAPSALRNAEVDDWRATVRIAYEHLQEMVGESGKLFLVGYSNGGLLAASAAQLARLRSNPFFSYIERRLIETTGQTDER